MNINKTQAYVLGTLAVGLFTGASVAIYMATHKNSRDFSNLKKHARNIKSDIKKKFKKSGNSLGKKAEAMIADAKNRMDDDRMPQL